MARRRLIVRADRPDFAILDAHHLGAAARPALGLDERQHIRRSATSLGSLSTTEKNTFRSNAVASTVFAPRPCGDQLDVGVKERVAESDHLTASSSRDADQARDERQDSLRSQW